MSAHAIVIGDGIDERVAAHCLARKGLSVRLLRDARINQPQIPQTGWIAPQIVRELGLSEHGLSIEQRDPWLQIGLAGGGRLELTRDIARSAEAISKLSPHDGGRWAAFCERMHALAELRPARAIVRVHLADFCRRTRDVARQLQPAAAGELDLKPRIALFDGQTVCGKSEIAHDLRCNPAGLEDVRLLSPHITQQPYG